jgi:hypothetical protein
VQSTNPDQMVARLSLAKDNRTDNVHFNLDYMLHVRSPRVSSSRLAGSPWDSSSGCSIWPPALYSG